MVSLESSMSLNIPWSLLVKAVPHSVKYFKTIIGDIEEYYRSGTLRAQLPEIYTEKPYRSIRIIPYQNSERYSKVLINQLINQYKGNINLSMQYFTLLYSIQFPVKKKSCASLFMVPIEYLVPKKLYLSGLNSSLPE